MYSPQLLDHFASPRNVGELPAATHRVEVSNPVCGDTLRLSAIVEAGIVRDARFLCRGCAAAIACGSLLTERIKGRELATLPSLTADLLELDLGGLQPAMQHAAHLAVEALRRLSAAPQLSA